MAEQQHTWVDVDLFAGAGGLAVGLTRAGFGPIYCYEKDVHACSTLRHNSSSDRCSIRGQVVEGDVADNKKWEELTNPVRLLAAGAPCQPFSVGGNHLAYKDGRNLFPEVIRAARTLRPAAILIENVRGLLRPPFLPYFDYILRQLECPSVDPRHYKTWEKHDEAIRRRQCGVGYVPDYIVVWRLLDAADFGVPQNRCRVFIVATRNDLPVYRFPKPTHSRDALLHAQRKGTYWETHGIKKPSAANMPFPDLEVDEERLQLHPWRTVRDGLIGLPEPSMTAEAATMNHWLIPGAKHYDGHQGSLMDWPSKTIKAGVHGVPGGENALIDAQGRFRYYTFREAARMQSFPDNHEFKGMRIHITRQLGNAVPCSLAEVVALPLFELLNANMSPCGKGRS